MDHHHPGEHDMRMTGSPLLDAALLGLLLAALAVGAVMLLRGRGSPTTLLRGTRAEAAHLLMNAAMVWMLTPWWSPLAAWTVVAASGATAAALLALLVLHDRTVEHRAASVYHLVAVIVLAGTAFLMAPAGEPCRADGWVGTLCWILAAVFALDLIATVFLAAAPPARVTAATPPASGEGRRGAIAVAPARTTQEQVRDLRVAAFPHAGMDLGMVAMLVTLT